MGWIECHGGGHSKQSNFADWFDCFSVYLIVAVGASFKTAAAPVSQWGKEEEEDKKDAKDSDDEKEALNDSMTLNCS